MVELTLQTHTNAVNLARRHTELNEPDLVQMNLYEDAEPTSPKKQYNHDVCQNLASRLMHKSQLPTPCLQYKDVVHQVDRRDRDNTHGSELMS